MKQKKQRFDLRTAGILAGLVVLTLFVYLPVTGHGFVSIDDPTYVSANPHVARGVTGEALAWAFTTGRAGNWHPLTWISHLLDVSLFGLDAARHHATTVVFHLINTLLLFVVLRAMTGAVWRSAIVAALFAVHPLHVESVAWLSERKDVLSTLFWLLATWAYVGYARRPGVARYVLVAVLLALGLMAKPMLVTLPFVFLLLDVWPLGRIGASAGADSRVARWRGVVIEKLPLVAIVMASSVVTFIAQRQGGAVSDLDAIPFGHRMANGVVAYATYLVKMVWPAGLSVFYPQPVSVPVLTVVGALVLLSVVTALVVRERGRRPFLAVGWLWYLGTLVPVIGLVQVGTQAMADRYTYVPLIGVFVGIVWLVDEWLRAKTAARIAGLVGAAVIVCALAVTARAQVAVWRDSETLWRHALVVAPDNYYAHNALGALLNERGQIDEAVPHFTEAVGLQPSFPDAHNNLGLTLERRGRLEEAAAQYRAAVEINAGFAEAHNNLGAVLMRTGRVDEAVGHLRTAISLDPERAVTYSNLGQALAVRGELAAAITEFRRALEHQPDLAVAHVNLGQALASQGQLDEAVSHYQEALKSDPRSVDAYNSLGMAFAAQGKHDQAAAAYLEALKVNPQSAAAHTNLGFTLAVQGKVAESIAHLSEAVRIQPDLEGAHLYLGMALAAGGRFAEADAQFNETLRLNPSNEGARRGLAMLGQRR
jgi:protein O-mannosyl-transferase